MLTIRKSAKSVSKKTKTKSKMSKEMQRTRQP